MPREYDNTGKVISAVEHATKAALAAAVVDMHNQAVLLTPFKTGNLAGSLSWTVGGEHSGVKHPATAKDGVRRTSKTDTAYLGTNVHYACIFNSHTNIVTDKGVKTIGQIKENDLVLTQTGEYHPVIAKTKFPAKEKPDLIDVVVPWRSGQNHKITLTLDHKVLVYRDGRNKWVMAGDLCKTDMLFTRRKLANNKNSGPVKVCEQCGCDHRNSGAKYCSLACRNAAFATGKNPHIGKKHSESARKKMSESRKRFHQENPEQHINRILARKGNTTKAERAVEGWLQERGVDYEKQYKIGSHYVDFFVPEENVVMEADGAFWHQNQQTDIERDRAIKQVMPDAKVVHVHFYEERFSPDLVFNPLPGVFYVACNPSVGSYVEPDLFQPKPIVELHRWRYGEKKHPNDPTRANLYDLSVANVHSYLANGILVSNSHVEYGTKKMSAQSYLRASLDARKKYTKEIMARHYKKAIEGVTR